MNTAFESPAEPVSATERIYGVRLSWKAGLGSLGLIFFLAGSVGCWYFGTGHEVRDRNSEILLTAISGAFAALGMCVAVLVFRGALILRDEAIAVQGILFRRTVPTQQIAGYRRLPQHNSPPLLVLVLRPGHGRDLKISMMFQPDAYFDRWLRRFPDLDARDAAAAQEAILSDLALGATPENRMATVNAAKRVQRFAAIATYVIAAWGWFYPVPYPLVISVLAALPIIVIFVVMQSNGLYRIDEQRNDVHPNFAIPFIIPGLILAMRAVVDFNVLSWQRPAMFALAIGIVMLAFSVVVDPRVRSRRVTLIALLFCTFMYGLGAGLQANALLDRSPVAAFAPVVVGHSTTHGRHTEYRLRVEAWGPFTNPNNVEVNRHVYAAVSVGDPVCINLRAGALAIPWYTVHPCK
jgi:hypothetical protein